MLQLVSLVPHTLVCGALPHWTGSIDAINQKARYRYSFQQRGKEPDLAGVDGAELRSSVFILPASSRICILIGIGRVHTVRPFGIHQLNSAGNTGQWQSPHFCFKKIRRPSSKFSGAGQMRDMEFLE